MPTLLLDMYQVFTFLGFQVFKLLLNLFLLLLPFLVFQGAVAVSSVLCIG